MLAGSPHDSGESIVSQITPSMQIPGLQGGFWGAQRDFNKTQAINAGTDFGASTQTDITTYTGNMGGQWKNVTTPAGANTEFSIPHDLGRVPSHYHYIMEKDGNVYQLPDTGTAWTITEIFVKCSASSSKLRIFIM